MREQRPETFERAGYTVVLSEAPPPNAALLYPSTFNAFVRQLDEGIAEAMQIPAALLVEGPSSVAVRNLYTRGDR